MDERIGFNFVYFKQTRVGRFRKDTGFLLSPEEVNACKSVLD